MPSEPLPPPGRKDPKDNLFVGGFPFEMSEEELGALFGPCGKVVRVKILTDRETGKSRGLAFVKMATEADAKAAIAKLNDSRVGTRQIFVAEARPAELRPGPGRVRPNFIERRSGKDRRRSGGASGGGPRKSFGGAKKWERKPWAPPKREDPFLKFKKTKDFRQGQWEPKPGGTGGKRSWKPKPEGGFKKKEGFGPKKWDRKPGAAGPKRWDRKPGAGPRKWGRKPEKKWGPNPHRVKPGGSGTP